MRVTQFNHKMILDNTPLESPNEAVYGKGAPWEAPELGHFKYLEMFAKITEVAAEHGIMIMMAAHRLFPDAWPGKGEQHLTPHFLQPALTGLMRSCNCRLVVRWRHDRRESQGIMDKDSWPHVQAMELFRDRLAE